MNRSNDSAAVAVKPAVAKRWLATIGVGGFLFFLIKGLVWLGIGAAALVAAW